MPIKGMTDRESLRPRLPRLGKLRKGAEKTGNKPGADLDHFRLDSKHPEVTAAFVEAYGETPRVINAILYGNTVKDVFPTWIEAWDAAGLVMRSDGENWLLWRDGSEYKRGSKPHRDIEGQSIVGRLEFLVPELLSAGIVGTVTIETHSNNDIRNISTVLATIEQERGGLRGAQIVIRRVLESISIPGWGDRKGQRSRADKWLVKIELPRAMFAALEAADQTRAALPAPQEDYVDGDYHEVEPEEEGPEDPKDNHWLNWVDSKGRTARNAVFGLIKRLGLEKDEAYEVLGIESLYDWHPDTTKFDEVGRGAAMMELKERLEEYAESKPPSEPEPEEDSPPF